MQHYQPLSSVIELCLCLKTGTKLSYSKTGLAPASPATIADNRVQFLRIILFISPLINGNVGVRYQELLCLTFKIELLEIHFN